MKWFEIKTNAGARPGYPEDNTICVSGLSLQDALDNYTKNRNQVNLQGTVVQIREVYYVRTFNEEEL